MRRLEEVIMPVSGRAGPGHSLPVYSVTKHAGFVPQRDYFKKQVASVDTTSYKVVRAGQFAYATIHLDEGSIGFAPEDCIVSPMYTVFAVDSEKVDTTYLSRMLRSPQAIARYGSLGRGSAERRKSISLKALGTLRVPLPDLPEQRRIAATLDAADAIRAKRRAQLAHLDDLPQALFHEMFAGRSDAVVPLGEVVPSIDSGVSPVAESRAAVGDEWGVLKLGAVTYGKFRPWENKAFLGDASFLRRHEVKDGDVLMTRKNTPELVGAVVFVRDVPPRLAIPDLVFRLNIDHERLDGAYVQALLMSRRMRRRVRGLASGSAASMSNISKSRLSALWIPVPPLALQQQFAAKVEAIHAERARVARALEADDELFAALQHRAFRGEL